MARRPAQRPAHAQPRRLRPPPALLPRTGQDAQGRPAALRERCRHLRRQRETAAVNAIARTFHDYWLRHRAESLAAFRILLGLTILASLATGSFRTMRTTCAEDGICPA